MRKMIILAVAAMVLSSCGVTHIVMDKTYKGNRIALTSDTRAFRYEDGNMKIALGAKVAARDTVMALLLTYDGDTNSGIFDKDDRIIITLKDGSEVKLKNIYDKEFEKSEEIVQTERYKTDYLLAYSYSPLTDMVYISPVEVSRMVPEVYNVKTTNSYGLYPVSKSQFNSIITKGVSGVCVESMLGDASMKDAQYLPEMLLDLYNCLIPHLRGRK